MISIEHVFDENGVECPECGGLTNFMFLVNTSNGEMFLCAGCIGKLMKEINKHALLDR